jgi:long-subunit acyl-CoA synthetase (AMP-forming)
MGASNSIDMVPPAHIHICAANSVIMNTVHNSLMPYNFTITCTSEERTQEERDNIIKNANLVIFIVSQETAKSFAQLGEYDVILNNFKRVVYYFHKIKHVDNVIEKSLHDYLTRNQRIICYSTEKLREHLEREFLNPNREEILLGTELYEKDELDETCKTTKRRNAVVLGETPYNSPEEDEE